VLQLQNAARSDPTKQKLTQGIGKQGADEARTAIGAHLVKHLVIFGQKRKLCTRPQLYFPLVAAGLGLDRNHPSIASINLKTVRILVFLEVLLILEMH
jgi:hypothetical protein